MTQLSLTFYKQISRFLAFEFHFRCREYANIDIIARRLQILIYTVYTIENELAWIGTERMEMLLNLAWLWLEDAVRTVVGSRSRRKKGWDDGGNNRDYNCQRGEPLCSRTLLFIRVEQWRRFVREVKENDSTKSPFPLDQYLALSSHLSFSMCKKCITDLLIVEENN